VQERGCWALESLVYSNAENWTRAWAAGGVEAVVAAMRAHASDARVQERGCWALESLVYSNAENRTRAGAAGGVEAVVAAMRAHASDARVQEHGCWALRNLGSNNAENKKRAGAAGGVEAVVAAMRAHASDARVQERGCDFFLAFQTPYLCFALALPQEIRTKLRDMGVPELVQEALDRFPNDRGLQWSGERLLPMLLSWGVCA
jgi:hypothetical protein